MIDQTLPRLLDAPGHAGGRDRVGVGAGAEREARALRAGHLGRFAGREIGRLELARDRQRRQHHAGMHRADDELGIAALDQVAQLARAGRRIGLGVLGDQLDLAAGDAAALVDDLDRRLGRLVVPEAPRRDDAGQVAMVPDHDRARGLREQVLGDGEARRAGRAARERRLRGSCGGIIFCCLMLFSSRDISWVSLAGQPR